MKRRHCEAKMVCEWKMRGKRHKGEGQKEMRGIQGEDKG